MAVSVFTGCDCGLLYAPTEEEEKKKKGEGRRPGDHEGEAASAGSPTTTLRRLSIAVVDGNARGLLAKPTEAQETKENEEKSKENEAGSSKGNATQLQETASAENG